MSRVELPPGVQVLERGWLSSNSVLLGGDARGAVLVDTGYSSHAVQTAALVEQALRSDSTALRLIINTHLHSDHCGGNAHLQSLHHCPIWIPPGDYANALAWNEDRLSYRLTGQDCPRFRPDAVISPGQVLHLGGRDWEVHAAPGHDTHAVVLFEPESRTLISGDALWEHGFGIVFPALDGQQAAFDEVSDTLRMIEQLSPALVIPGHGAPFATLDTALDQAQARIAFFRANPDRHARHAAKALIVFHLLETRQASVDELQQWLSTTPIHRAMWRSFYEHIPLKSWNAELINELGRAGALSIEGELIRIA